MQGRNEVVILGPGFYRQVSDDMFYLYF
jgi:hypothetical protein